VQPSVSVPPQAPHNKEPPTIALTSRIAPTVTAWPR
jgi:hypothetical protein